MKLSYFTKLSGTSFRQEEIKKLKARTMLRVIPRPENEYDQFAIEVQALLDDGWTQIGWIPKGKNVDMAEWLGQGGKVNIMISAVTGGGKDTPTMGVNVAVEYGEDDSVDLSKLKKEKVIYGDSDFIYFDEANHLAYDADGKLLLSGSKFEEKYHPEFNLKYPAKAIAKRSGLYESDILDLWDHKRDMSANYGTLVHKALEEAHNFLPIIRKLDENLEEEELFNRLLPNDLAKIVNAYFKFRKEITPGFLDKKIDVEARIKLGEYTGIVDNLEWDNDCFNLYDYKVTEEIKTVKYTGGMKEKKYTLQQNFYRNIIEKATNKKCLSMALLVWDGESWKKEDISFIDIEDLL